MPKILFNKVVKYPLGIGITIFAIWFLPLIMGAIALIFSMEASGKPLLKYSMFSHNFSQVYTGSLELYTKDPRAAKVDAVFAKYKCPMYGKGPYIVKKADENNIPYWVVASIAFQESSCGKNTPEPEGVEESYNAWGYGVWGRHIKTFQNWEAGISAVSTYLSKNFYSKGITDTCEIMKVYTPPSKGSWCNGVEYFGDMIRNYTT